ncbi:CS1 type fimbrial major subunit [Enterobacillus tribolii]|uniref:CS1 type fimbrial major subunit n=1 Tax=Enterobacillus tribolii TaxID=1487935 RepID=A0A370R3I4_9GAMM|nr:CS1 type fimbrial major subunit [Enterobacillus tribolii]MBW7984056.1 fimbrial protein [Enterobacillus tribolii]RDK96997.1 CS1 type fimbrial major subunit [Enterobacillus tribolii]
MKYMIKPVIAAILLATAGSALAIQKDITVTANVDPSIDMTQADGSALPNSVEMQYVPGSGLSPVSIMSKIWSNSTSSGDGDVHMKLIAEPQLVNSTGADATPVPLSVAWGSDVLSTSKDLALKTGDIFPNGADAATTGSVSRALKISQTTKGALPAGSYQGVVSIYLFQDAATGG